MVEYRLAVMVMDMAPSKNNLHLRIHCYLFRLCLLYSMHQADNLSRYYMLDRYNLDIVVAREAEVEAEVD